MQRGPQFQFSDHTCLLPVQMIEPSVKLVAREIIEGHLDEDVPMLCFGGPKPMIKLLQFVIALESFPNEAKAFRAAAFNDRGEQKPVEKAPQWIAMTKT